MERTILHCDLNGFYASVEALYHPEFRDRPLAVGGNVEDRHGIILAKNEPAKKYRIMTGETLAEARCKCPELVIIPPNFPRYLSFSNRVRTIMKDYTDLIEPFGIDEAWMDVSGCNKLFGSGEKIADELRKRIKFELGITASVGVSYNKIFAKLGSDYKKPDATTIIGKAEKAKIVDPLPIGDLLYLGRSSELTLHSIGVRTIGQLAKLPPDLLKGMFGKNGLTLWEFANGYEHSPVRYWGQDVPVKSIGNSVTTKRDLITVDDLKIVLYVLAQSVAARLRDQNYQAKKIAVYWRDNELHGDGHQMILELPSSSGKELWTQGMNLLLKYYDLSVPLRSLGIKAFDLTSSSQDQQLNLFTDQTQRDKQLELEKTIDLVKQRFGYQSIKTGLLAEDLQLSNFDPKNEHVIHPESFFH